ncbi:MAG: hypothetical protein HRU15_04195, partial [Planctomycetes bacterium]|nr:hypothetical protein [Planctomycetota bacterium]
VSLFDEPAGNQDYKAWKTAINRAQSYNDAGFKTSGFSSMHGAEMHAHQEELFTMCQSVFLGLHDAEACKTMEKIGSEPMVYNNGLERYFQGVHLYRNIHIGVKARIDWIATIIQGYQYDMLDAREPDMSVFYFHDTHGILLSPAYVGVAEGCTDARILLSVEQKLKDGANPAISAYLKKINDAPYRVSLDAAIINKIRSDGLKLLGY